MSSVVAVARITSELATRPQNPRKGTIILCMRSILILAALGHLADCAQSRAGALGKPDDVVQDVTFCHLAKSPAEFAGRTIRIRGIYRYALEENEFESAECCPDELGDRFHASIDGNPKYPNASSERLAQKLTARMSATAMVVFVGTLNGHTLEVERVERIEKLSHPKDKDHEPLWARKRCGVNHVPGE